ncbi:MAG TPA: DUF2950 domain-containing protein [Dissulfurispiraceae bacterium]|nr:DUF2950 domain-containing protein [Dissulfurispiraceae bacterium]
MKNTLHTLQKVTLCGFLFSLILIVSLFLVAAGDAAAKAIKQKGFASPEEAVTALVNGVKADDKETVWAILGGKGLLSSGDPVEDKADVARFIAAYDQKNKIEKPSENKAVLSVGPDDWPFPIPVVKRGDAWYFDTNAGKQELFNRRIGRNELRVIDAMRAYVDMQREYASRDWDGDGIYPYAQKIMSTPGKKDGLYWEPKAGEPESPLGPFFARAAAEGYGKKGGSGKPAPFHGYYFKILKAQGKHANGGAFDYVAKGNMILGYGMLAYPAKYGSSGIMTFVVNHEGVVYQKDLGKDTAKRARAINTYDPDRTWKKVEEPKK